MLVFAWHSGSVSTWLLLMQRKYLTAVYSAVLITCFGIYSHISNTNSGVGDPQL